LDDLSRAASVMAAGPDTGRPPHWKPNAGRRCAFQLAAKPQPFRAEKIKPQPFGEEKILKGPGPREPLG
jgi:hypothetical protein